MSINIWTDSMQHAALLGKPVLFTNWLIQRDIIPDGGTAMTCGGHINLPAPEPLWWIMPLTIMQEPYFLQSL